jgi:hypothetical protein
MTANTLIAVLGVASLCWSHQAGAFECPRPEKTSPGVLKETTQDEQVLSQMFTGGDIENKIGIAVATLQKKYPQVTDSELVNYLMGGYCPVVSRMPGLSEAQKTAKVEHFAATLFELLSEQKL